MNLIEEKQRSIIFQFGRDRKEMLGMSSSSVRMKSEIIGAITTRNVEVKSLVKWQLEVNG
jgi:hypothetical protein